MASRSFLGEHLCLVGKILIHSHRLFLSTTDALRSIVRGTHTTLFTPAIDGNFTLLLEPQIKRFILLVHPTAWTYYYNYNEHGWGNLPYPYSSSIWKWRTAKWKRRFPQSNAETSKTSRVLQLNAKVSVLIYVSLQATGLSFYEMLLSLTVSEI